MPNQAQLLAVEATRKNTVGEAKKSFYHLVQRDLFGGLDRTYVPFDADNGVQLPGERKMPQADASEALSEFMAASVSLIDLIAAKDNTNRFATADITLADGQVIAREVPVSTLLMLEREFNDWRAHLRKLPTHDPAYRWEWDESQGMWRTVEPERSVRNEQEPAVLVKYPATDKHPAQTETYQKQTAVGTWTVQRYTTALPAARLKAALARLEVLIEAVKNAREAANKTEVVDKKVGDALFYFLMTGNAPAGA